MPALGAWDWTIPFWEGLATGDVGGVPGEPSLSEGSLGLGDREILEAGHLHLGEAARGVHGRRCDPTGTDEPAGGSSGSPVRPGPWSEASCAELTTRPS